ncbi:MAG: mannonate dehydratase [Chloroflexi bacterium]|nr:mannonate dehydratase [Chloroflexota bacterium]
MWANYTYFIRAVLPVAEKAVALAVHPDDPPVPTLGGIARLFNEPAGFPSGRREIAPARTTAWTSPWGCFSEMGLDVIEQIEYFASRGKIIYVHFRDVQGCVPNARRASWARAMSTWSMPSALKRSGFNGFIIDDHVPPHMIDDSDWSHRGHAHQTGYILGLVEAARKPC